jgi:hypothetical protein
VIVGFAGLLAACTSEPSSHASTAISNPTTATTIALIAHSTSALDVVLQIGDYHLGWGPDMSVTGPEVVLYGDGSLYAELFDGVHDGQPLWSRLQAKLTETQVQALLAPGEHLPIDPTMNTIAADTFPTLIVSGTHRWEINDPQAEPFASYLGNLTDTVNSFATQTWVPDRWIVRPFSSPTCTVTSSPSRDTFYDAPVYPGLLDHFTLGAVECYPAP